VVVVLVLVVAANLETSLKQRREERGERREEREEEREERREKRGERREERGERGEGRGVLLLSAIPGWGIEGSAKDPGGYLCKRVISGGNSNGVWGSKTGLLSGPRYALGLA
jgi:hypothetical protein